MHSNVAYEFSISLPRGGVVNTFSTSPVKRMRDCVVCVAEERIQQFPMIGIKENKSFTIIAESISTVGAKNFTFSTPKPSLPLSSRARAGVHIYKQLFVLRALPSRPYPGLSRKRNCSNRLSVCWCITNNERHSSSTTTQLKRHLQLPVANKLQRSSFGTGGTLANSQSNSTSALLPSTVVSGLAAAVNYILKLYHLPYR